MTKDDIAKEFYDSKAWLNNISMTDAYIEFLENKILEMEKDVVKEI